MTALQGMIAATGAAAPWKKHRMPSSLRALRNTYKMLPPSVCYLTLMRLEKSFEGQGNSLLERVAEVGGDNSSAAPVEG